MTGYSLVCEHLTAGLKPGLSLGASHYGPLSKEASMNAEELRAMQAPVKARYKADPKTGSATLRAQGTLGMENITCKVESFKGSIEAGLHPATGGDGQFACSGDMLLE